MADDEISDGPHPKKMRHEQGTGNILDSFIKNKTYDVSIFLFDNFYKVQYCIMLKISLTRKFLDLLNIKRKIL